MTTQTEESSWQDADEVAKALALNLSNIGSISKYQKDKSIHPFIDAKGAEHDLGLISKDIKIFADKLKEINTKHKGKSGPIVTEDDNIEFIDTMVSYSDLSEDINLVLMPTFRSLCDNISRAKDIKEKSIGAQA